MEYGQKKKPNLSVTKTYYKCSFYGCLIGSDRFTVVFVPLENSDSSRLMCYMLINGTETNHSSLQGHSNLLKDWITLIITCVNVHLECGKYN